MSRRPAAVLPDCAICGGHVAPDVNDDGQAIEACTRCGNAQRTPTPRINLADLREQIATVREARPIFCDACLLKRCTSCVTVGCDCPRPRHPHRPAGDITADGLALLAAEQTGHLTPAEV